jgi:hypothetical protein
VFTDEEEANPTSSDVQEVGAVAEPELLNVKVKKTKKKKSSDSAEIQNCEERQVK